MRAVDRRNITARTGHDLVADSCMFASGMSRFAAICPLISLIYLMLLTTACIS